MPNINKIINKLRQLFLSPGSSLELWLRTRYHKARATRLSFKIMDHFSWRSYIHRRSYEKDLPLPEVAGYSNFPSVSFILSINDAEFEDVATTVRSIKKLSMKKLEIIFVDQTGIRQPYIFKTFIKEANINYLGLIEKDFLEHISGKFVIFCQAGDIFSEKLLSYFYQNLQENPQTDIFYFDCEYYDKSKKRWMPFFKPTEIPEAIFLSTNMLSRSLINLEKLKEIWSLVDLYIDFEACEYDICLNLYESGIISKHIPAFLVQQKSLATSQSPIIPEVIINYLSKCGLPDVSCDKSFSPPRFTWKRDDPSVAVIIPTKNNQRYLKPLLSSILSTKGDTDLSVTLVDNDTQEKRTLDYYSNLEHNKIINFVHYDQPFNYSEAINLGVTQTDSDLIVLMNDDMQIKNEKWLDEVTQWAIRPEVGVVGGKLLRADHTIQHTGVVLGLMGLAGHLYLNAPEHYNGLLGSVDWYRNYLAVTGAFQVMRRNVFNEVGGYNLDYQLAFGDIDFCLRVHEVGYQIIYTPYAQLYHYQGKSRGYTTPVPDLLKGFRDFRKYVINGDPYFSPVLTYTLVPECILGESSREEKIQQLEERIRYLTKDR